MSNNEILQNQNKRRNLHSSQNNSVKNIMSSSDKMLPAARESMEHQQCISERAPTETYHQPAVLKAPSHMLIPDKCSVSLPH